MDLETRLKKEILLLDGGTGTMLQRFGMQVGTIPETLNIEKPDWILRLHRGYIEAGSDIVYANTFGANRLKLAGTRYTVDELVGAAIRLAKEAARGDALVALDIGPLGQLLAPTGTLSFEEAYDLFAEIVEAGKGADLVVIETMTDLQETKAAVLAAKEHANLPVFVTMTFEENGRTFTGCSVPAMCLTLEGLGVDALGINCSLGPKELLPIVEEISKWTSLPIIVKPNAGLPDPVTNAYDITPEDFVSYVEQMLPFGPRVLGGCCGTDPEYIRGLRGLIDRVCACGNRAHGAYSESAENTSDSITTVASGESAESTSDSVTTVLSDESTSDSVTTVASGEIVKSTSASDSAIKHTGKPARVLSVCSATRTVTVDRPRIIGERINPTGKKRFREALASGDMDYILRQAIEQVEAGADILDVNVGAPGVDEKEMMVQVVRALQAVTDVPLQLDSTKPDVLEAALRAYVGKPLVNSVNGEQAVMDKILPLVAKYGAAVVALTLDENGIPKKAEERFAIAKRILSEAQKYGIPRENVVIDCLVLTVSSEQKAARETLRAVRMVRDELGLNTCLGVSNISFGLPARGAVNTAFFTLALEAGLTLPIMNPNISSMMWAYRSFLALTAQDENSLEFIAYAQDHQTDAEALAALKKTVAQGASRPFYSGLPSGDLPGIGLPSNGQTSAGQPVFGSPLNGQTSVGQPVFGLPSNEQAFAGQPVFGLPSNGQAFPRQASVPLTPIGQEAARTVLYEKSSSGNEPPLSHPVGCTCGRCAGGSPASLASPEGAAILKAMETGMKSQGRDITARLLTRIPSMDIINGILIPALDTVGEKFEKGKLFLPQLILAADVAKECFDIIKERLAEEKKNGDTASEAENATFSNENATSPAGNVSYPAGNATLPAGKPSSSTEENSSRGRIVLATVKGDIHDIGKNIVKVILENYGYEVIDLGKDVPPERIVETVLSKNVRLVGLSALMTTTLGSMETTVRLLREANAPCKVMVGGAVLTPDYAKKIGADYYAKDAKQGADIAKQVFDNANT